MYYSETYIFVLRFKKLFCKTPLSFKGLAGIALTSQHSRCPIIVNHFWCVCAIFPFCSRKVFENEKLEQELEKVLHWRRQRLVHRNLNLIGENENFIPSVMHVLLDSLDVILEFSQKFKVEPGPNKLQYIFSPNFQFEIF